MSNDSSVFDCLGMSLFPQSFEGQFCWIENSWLRIFYSSTLNECHSTTFWSQLFLMRCHILIILSFSVHNNFLLLLSRFSLDLWLFQQSNNCDVSRFSLYPTWGSLNFLGLYINSFHQIWKVLGH